jgi:hypothetical protein
MKVNSQQRQHLFNSLKQFYKRYPNEKYTIFHFNQAFRKRINNKRDAWIGVIGDTGVGKSMFVIMEQILFKRGFDLNKNVCYIPKGNEIIDKFKKLNKSTLLIDEAAKEMRSVNWQSKQQQGVNETAMTERYKSNMVFLNMPEFNEFTKSMRRGSLLFRIVIPYRTDKYARVIVYRKSRNFRAEDKWGDKEANKIYQNLEKRKKEITNEKILEIERSVPNYVMDFIVPNLELILPEVTNEYKRLKIESRKVQEEQLPESINLYKKKYEDLLNRATKIIFNNELDLGTGIKVTKTEMCKSLGVTINIFNKFLKLEKPKAGLVQKNKKI